MSNTIRFLVAALVSAASIGVAQAGETFRTFKENSWVCVSPQVYDDAMVRVNGTGAQDIEVLRKELGDNKQCMLVDGEIVESMMAPFALVLNREGTKVQVQFIVSFRQRVEFLHRLINRFVLVGWTEEANLVPKQIM